MSRFDRWGREGMPEGETLRQIQKKIANTMAGVLQDARHGISPSASMIPDKQREEPRPASGGTVPLAQPPGIEILDRLVDAQDRKDRIVRLREAAENAWIESQLEESEPRVQSEYNPFDKKNMSRRLALHGHGFQI